MSTLSVSFKEPNQAGNLLVARIICKSSMEPFITDSLGNTWMTVYARRRFKKFWVVRAVVQNCAPGKDTVTATFTGDDGRLLIGEAN